MTRTFTAIATAATIAFSAFAAQAAEVQLTREIQAGSLKEQGVDMVVYYTDEKTHLEVVATYVETENPHDPQRIRMGLQDGDDVTFALPGIPGTNYTFARDGMTVTITTTSKMRMAEVAE
jgi:hypothetical protein